MPSPPRARLACQTCARRKVKCDKGSPCTNCLKQGIFCIAVERRRWSCGRSSKQVAGRDRAMTDGESASVDRFTKDVRNQESTTDADSKALSRLEVQKALLDVFLRQVDPIFKILHRPSLCAFLLEGKQYLNYDRGHPAPVALAAAVFYAASVTLSDEQSIGLCGERKETVVAKYKNEAKSALMKVDFLATNELTVLQAFVLSLVAARTQDRSRRAWTMLSVALRIAQALSLHLVDPPFPLRPFEREMRRRLWHLIGWLDVEASMDRATEPMMLSLWIQPHPLSDVNDEDFEFDSEEILRTKSSGITDATLPRIVSLAQCILRSFNLSQFSEQGITDVTMRQQAVHSFRNSTKVFLAGCEPGTSAFHWFISQLRDRIYDVLRLIALCPLRGGRVTFPVHTDTRILALATDIVTKRHRLYRDPRADLWRWLEPFFFPWQALAVALAQVSTSRERWAVARYWPMIENTYIHYSQLAAETPHVLPGKSMEDLMRDARAMRDKMASIGMLGVSDVREPANSEFVSSDTPLLDPVFCSQQDLQPTVPDVLPVTEWDMPHAGQAQDIDAWAQYGSLGNDLPELEDFDFSVYFSSQAYYPNQRG